MLVIKILTTSDIDMITIIKSAHLRFTKIYRCLNLSSSNIKLKLEKECPKKLCFREKKKYFEYVSKR